ACAQHRDPDGSPRAHHSVPARRVPCRGRGCAASLHRHRKPGLLHVPRGADGFAAAGDLPKRHPGVPRPAADCLGHRPHPPRDCGIAECLGAPGGAANEEAYTMSEIPVIALRPNEVSAALTEIEPEPSPAVQVRELGVRFGSKLVLSGVGMDFPTGRITALIGPSGCGKTTLLRSLNRMHDTTPGAVVLGTVLLGHIDIYGPDVNPTQIRARIGMVFQRANPFPTLSIYDNVV